MAPNLYKSMSGSFSFYVSLDFGPETKMDKICVVKIKSQTKIPGVTVCLDPLGSLTPGGQDTLGYLDPRPGYLDPQVAKYPLSGILPADTLIGVY